MRERAIAILGETNGNPIKDQIRRLGRTPLTELSKKRSILCYTHTHTHTHTDMERGDVLKDTGLVRLEGGKVNGHPASCVFRPDRKRLIPVLPRIEFENITVSYHTIPSSFCVTETFFTQDETVKKARSSCNINGLAVIRHTRVVPCLTARHDRQRVLLVRWGSHKS